MSTIRLTVITKEDCDPCVTLHQRLDFMLKDNAKFKRMISEIRYIDRDDWDGQANYFPTIRFENSETGKLYLVLEGSYSATTLFWKTVRAHQYASNTEKIVPISKRKPKSCEDYNQLLAVNKKRKEEYANLQHKS